MQKIYFLPPSSYRHESIWGFGNGNGNANDDDEEEEAQ
jgi:hypothetical protein